MFACVQVYTGSYVPRSLLLSLLHFGPITAPPSSPSSPSSKDGREKGISSRGEISESAVRYKFRRAVVIRSRRIHCTPGGGGAMGRKKRGSQRGRPIGVRYSLSYCAGLNWMQKELQTSVGTVVCPPPPSSSSLEHDLMAPTAAVFTLARFPPPLSYDPAYDLFLFSLSLSFSPFLFL